MLFFSQLVTYAFTQFLTNDPHVLIMPSYCGYLEFEVLRGACPDKGTSFSRMDSTFKDLS